MTTLEMLKADPTYITFLRRSLTSVFAGFVLILAFTAIIYFQNTVKIEYFIFLDICILGLLFLLTTRHNRLYLKSIQIVPDTNELQFIIYKYDKIYETKNLKIVDCNLRIEKNIWSRYGSYNLNIYFNNKLIFKQTETGAWQTDAFLIITKYFNDLKGIPTYDTSIPKRNTLSKYFDGKESLIINS